MSSKKAQRGQGMVEYIIIVAVVAIACLTLVKQFGSDVGQGFSDASNEVSTLIN